MIEWLFSGFSFLLPWHALFVTFLKCKAGIDPTFLRFWKEIFVLIFFVVTCMLVLSKHHWKLSKIYKDNYILGLTTTFTIVSAIYIFFPYFTIKPSSLLGFKYDVFFFLCLIIGLYLPGLRNSTQSILKSIFISSTLIVGIFLTWYLFFDISATTHIFGFSDNVSTFKASQCLSFSQNVDGHHRFQATFGGPIRFSVFLVMTFLLYLGYIFDKKYISRFSKTLLIFIPGIIVFISILVSYTKTSFLGLFFGAFLFGFLSWKYLFRGKMKKKYFITGVILMVILFLSVAIAKKDLLLHPGAMINRLDNLSKSVEMFFYNPIGYGLGIAGPATQIGNSMESAGGWQIATASPNSVSTFLPENWFVQILLEQGLVGFFIFISLLIVIGIELFETLKNKKDFYSIALFSVFCTLIFMGLFTHVYEEAATSYILFLLVGIHLGNHSKKYN